MAKSKQQLADEAYHRAETRRAKSLQLDIEQAIEAQPATTVVQVSKIPLVCPHCNHDMHDAFGGAWTPMAPGQMFPYRLQCGHCGKIVTTTENVWEAVREERYQKVGISDVKPPKREPRERRTRGAG